MSTHSSLDNVHEETESILLHFNNLNIFQPNPPIDPSDSGDSKVCKSLEHYHPGKTDEIVTFSIEGLWGPKPFPNFEDDNLSQLLDIRFSIDKLWSVFAGISQNRGDQVSLVGSWTHFNKKVSCTISQKTLIK